MKHADAEQLEDKARKLRGTLDRIKRLYDAEQNTGVTVDSTAYSEEQTKLKNQVSELVYAADALVDATDTFEIVKDDETVATVDLPDPALERNTSKTLPSPPK